MATNPIRKSPVFPPGHKWPIRRRSDGYESEVTALVRAMLEDEAVREDQRWAWRCWRNEPEALKKP